MHTRWFVHRQPHHLLSTMMIPVLQLIILVPLELRGTPCISKNNDFKFRMFQNELFAGSSCSSYGDWSCPRSRAPSHLSRQPWHRCCYPPGMPIDFTARTASPSSLTSRQTSLTARISSMQPVPLDDAIFGAFARPLSKHEVAR